MNSKTIKLLFVCGLLLTATIWLTSKSSSQSAKSADQSSNTVKTQPINYNPNDYVGSDACKDCHDEKGWKPAPKFQHARTDFPLEGKHAEVKCVACHARERDAHFSRSAFPAPSSEVFSRFKPVAHAACTSCHKDPHQNRYGQNCQSCHTVEGWLVLKGVAGVQAAGFFGIDWSVPAGEFVWQKQPAPAAAGARR